MINEGGEGMLKGGYSKSAPSNTPTASQVKARTLTNQSCPVPAGTFPRSIDTEIAGRSRPTFVIPGIAPSSS